MEKLISVPLCFWKIKKIRSQNIFTVFLTVPFHREVAFFHTSTSTILNVSVMLYSGTSTLHCLCT